MRDGETSHGGGDAMLPAEPSGSCAADDGAGNTGDRLLLLDALADPVWETDPTAKLTFVNRAWLELTGRTVEQALASSLLDGVHPEDEVASQLAFRRAFEARGPFSIEHRYRVHDDTYHWLSARGRPLFGRGGAFLGFAGSWHDLESRRAAASALRLAALVLSSSSEGLVVTDLTGAIVAVNPAYCRITGYDAASLIGDNPRLLPSGRQDAAFYERMWAELLATGHFEGEVWNRKKSGEIFPVRLTMSAVKDEHACTVAYAGLVVDITDSKATDERVRAMAQFDPLTRLPNRELLGDRLGQAFAVARRDGSKVAVLFLDLDHFKGVNDSLGHRMGDVLLQEVAARLKGAVRGADTVARLGGDEFVVMLTEVRSAAQVVGVTDKILRALGQPFTLGPHHVIVTPSIGISLFPDDAAEPEDGLSNADAAMYEVKQRGRNGYRFFTRAVEARAAEVLATERDLASALDRQELDLYWQPEVKLATGRIVGLEALVRWHRPGFGLVPASRFFPVAEERGLSVAIGAWVLATACDAARSLRNAGSADVRIAVNLSPQELRQPHLARRIASAATGLDLALLDFEIGESALTRDGVRDGIRVADFVAEGRTLGLHFSVDNYGTGSSSIAQLRRVRFSRLKLDGSLVRAAPRDPDVAAVTTAILDMARTLGLVALAEQIETPDELAFLRRLHCPEGQGNFFSPPVTFDEAIALLRRGTLEPRSA